MKICKQCNQGFEVTDDDRRFYEKAALEFNDKRYPLSEPTLCPMCRHQRRMTFRNERRLYHRKCDLCGQDKISCIAPDSSYKMYCHECWWSDKWDPLSYGRDFDFSRPFFEQFNELMLKVPKMGLVQMENQNSPYCNWLAYSKDTLLSPGSYYMDGCMYGRKNQHSRDIVDGVFVDSSELLYSCVNCNGCYNGRHLLNCRNCSDCMYVANATACKNCFMCSDIAGKVHHFKNQPCKKEEYERLVSEKMKLSPDELMKEFLEFAASVPKKYQNQLNCQDSYGDYLQNCKKAEFCFDSFDLEDCKTIFDCVKVKDSMDLTNFDEKIELCYEVCGGGDQCHRTMFSFCPVLSTECAYLHSCMHVQNCFGCDGLHQRASYCVLNKKYSPEEYEKLVPKIIEHMRGTGEWGEFFPSGISPFAYNETFAHEHFPLSQKEAQARGWKWKELKDRISNVTKTIPAERLPDSIANVPDDVLNWAIVCRDSKRPFQIQPQELAFYRKLSIPLPRCHPDVRYLNLMKLRNKRQLYDRKCDKCGTPIRTTYAPNQPEKVYCEKCYLSEVY